MGGNFPSVFLPPIFPLKLIEIESDQKMHVEMKFPEGKYYLRYSNEL